MLPELGEKRQTFRRCDFRVTRRRFIVVEWEPSDDLAEAVARLVDGGGLIRRTFSSNDREPQLERAKFVDGETHRPQEMVGGDLDRVRADEDLHVLDESAWHPIAIGKHAKVGDD